jgi:L-sorbose 1-phosphate reductase
MSLSQLPEMYKRWHLYGAGLENVGRNGTPETVPMPIVQDDELLVRHEACGICFSDIKIINLGGKHPRLQGRDLATNPVVMGHEVTLTVMQVGKNYQDRFAPGERYIVQADVYYKGVNVAYGYALTGGMSQYGIVTKELLDGDEGCYLLPISPTTNNAEAALVEPWACVEAAYRWTEREEVTGGDFVATQGISPEAFETGAKNLEKNGHVWIPAGFSLSRKVSVDVGKIHYDGQRYAKIGSPNVRNEIKPGGVAWFIGAAGPMGQMHAQRALSLPNPPRKLLVTDRHTHRLEALEQRLGALARERGVEMILVNVKEAEPDFERIAPEGFDDVVIMVPSVEAVEESFPLLAEDGVLNVFAGLARGTMITVDISLIAQKNTRIVGTSGSMIEDMITVRDKMETGILDTGASLAAIGGLEAFRDGLEGVKNSRFPGKTVIFPHVTDLPLTALPDLKATRPDVYIHLRDGQFWTDAAEKALLEG